LRENTDCSEDEEQGIWTTVSL